MLSVLVGIIVGGAYLWAIWNLVLSRKAVERDIKLNKQVAELLTSIYEEENATRTRS